MKDLGILIAAGVGLYIISQRNKEDDSKKLNDNVGDTFEPENPNVNQDDLRAVTANELTSGQISASEASQVSISSEEINLVKLIFDLELELNDVVKEILTNPQNYIEGTPTSLINDIRNYANDFESCINSGYNTLNTINPNNALSTQIVNIFNEVAQCAIEIREEVMYLAGEEGALASYVTPEGYELLEAETGQVLNDFINTYGGLPEPLGEPTPDSYSNASAKKTKFKSAREVLALQKKYPYNERNKKKPWWKCGCGNEGLGGCVGKVCIGPGKLSYAF